MAVVRDERSAHRAGTESAPVLETEKARQADSDKENFRVLDVSLPLAIVALGIVGIYIAAVATT
jgi:hypothetical protein